MFKKLFLTGLLSVVAILGLQAQRFMDTLDRGLIAVSQPSGGVYVSWRIYGTEYYDVGYNIYRDGVKLNVVPLEISNYIDAGGNSASKYSVSAVVNGVEQPRSAAVSVWDKDYLVIPKATRTSNDGTTDITEHFEPNDATFGDVDGDGQMEVFIKQWNTVDHNAGFPVSSVDFDRIEVYKLDGTLLWWIDCGPNLTDFQHNETNIAVYDWDMDGKAEAVMRAADGTIIHMADGTTYEIGNKSKNYRSDVVSGQTEKFIHSGSEFLVYMNGRTGKPYYCGEYPLKRLEQGETDLKKAWGDGYGHRSTKHFFGAPYLDGKKPSLFLARGIYTRHKMIAYDIDPTTHALTVRWRWNCNDASSPWYGNGYHNYSIADVDWDGRDEICFGSMVIDDNGQGLSTTGLGHGDAQHVGDFNPYVHGQEIYACNEDSPSNNYRDATTSKIYYRLAGGSDDGRAMCGNFTNEIPGAIGFSGHDSPISCVTNGYVDGISNDGISLNFRTYWDGDLCEESFNGVAVRNSNGAIYKYGQGAIRTFADTYTNNDTKATPCFQGDIFGDWREEIAMRDIDNNLRIYTTTIPTKWRIYTLLHDHQYRNAMVWQMNGYNQPPHISYYLGEMEGITIAPPPVTKMGKQLVSPGGTVSLAHNGKQVLLDETNNATYQVENGASPSVLFDNAPTWVKGHNDNDNIEYITYAHTLTGGGFAGAMRLVKQGDGILTLPNAIHTHTGTTDIWAGTLNFDGTMTKSRVWLNRFSILNSDGGRFLNSIEADYGASIRPGAQRRIGTLETDSLLLNFGSIVDFDIDGEGHSDYIVAKVIKLESKDWTVGPEHLAPRFHFTRLSTTVKPGVYVLAKVENIQGNLDAVNLTGLQGIKSKLIFENNELKLVVDDMREPSSVVWAPSSDNLWELDKQKNFKDNNTGDATSFVSGDQIIFTDNASNTSVVIGEPIYPRSILFNNNDKEYLLTGDSIGGKVDIEQNGTGTVRVDNINSFVGTLNLNAGALVIGKLGFEHGETIGALGSYTNQINFNGGTLVPANSLTTSHPMKMETKGGSIRTDDGITLTMAGSLSGMGSLVKAGSGILVLPSSVSIPNLYVNDGVVRAQESNNRHIYPSQIVLNGGSIQDPDNIYSYSSNFANVVVPEGGEGSWYMDQRCVYNGKLSGKGTLSAYATGPRMEIKGDWSAFSGTLNAYFNKTGTYNPEFTFNNSGLRNGNLNVNSGVTVSNSGRTFYLGGLTGNGTLTGRGQYVIGFRNEDVTYTGTFRDCRFSKVGSGLWTMSRNASSSFNGAISIKGGTLNLNDKQAVQQFFGTQNVIVADSGRLSGLGYVYRVYAQTGGTVAPGNATLSNPYGMLKADYAYIQNGSTLEFHVNTAKGLNSARSYLIVNRILEVNGTVKVTLRDGFKPVAGDSVVVWTCETFRGTPTFDLPDLSSFTSSEAPYGLKWDTSSMDKQGALYIIARDKDDETAVSAIDAETVVSVMIYTIDGRVAGKSSGRKATLGNMIGRLSLSRGIYILDMRAGSKREIRRVTIR